MKRSAAATLVLALTTLFLTLLAPRAFAADKDCADFATQRAAQIYYIHKGGPQFDPDDLDRDNDGIACDSNPCPCYYGTHIPSSPPARRTVHSHVHRDRLDPHRIAGEPVKWTVSVDPDRVRAVKLQRHANDGSWKTVAHGHTSGHGRWTVRRATLASTTSYRAVLAKQVTRTRIFTAATSGRKQLQIPGAERQADAPVDPHGPYGSDGADPGQAGACQRAGPLAAARGLRDMEDDPHRTREPQRCVELPLDHR